MKDKNIHTRLEEIARKHLGVPALHVKSHDFHNLSGFSIKVALREAFQQGEKSGYQEGFKNATEACDCQCLVKNN